MSNDTTENQITLGELIQLLQPHQKNSSNEPLPVYFDFCGLSPTGDLYSYRGIYAHLCIEAGGTYEESKVTVPALLDTLRKAIGKTYTGWKGGDFSMDEDTPLWVSQKPSACFGTAVVGVRSLGYMVVIQTAYVEY